MSELDDLQKQLKAALATVDSLRATAKKPKGKAAASPKTSGYEEWLFALMSQVDMVSDDMLESMLQSVRGAVQAGGAAITHYDEEAGTLTFRAAVGDGAEGIVGHTIPLQGTQHGSALVTETVIASRPLYTAIEEQAKAKFYNVMVAPLIWQDRKVGTISVVNKRDNADFSPDDVEEFGNFARTMTLAVEQNRILRRLSLRDADSAATDALLDEREQRLLSIARHTAALSTDPATLRTVDELLASMTTLSNSRSGW